MFLQSIRSSFRVHTLLCFILALSLTSAPAGFSASGVSAAKPATMSYGLVRQGELPASYAGLPLSFEMNQGQTHDRVKFLARAGGYLLFLTPTEAVMALDNPEGRRRGKENREERAGTEDKQPRPPRSIVRMQLVGGNPAPQIDGLEELATSTNYFSGSDPAQWRTAVPSYARVRYGQVYPGIDMVYYGNRRQLEYDFVVAPGADPSVVQLAFKGIENFEISRMGDLLLHTSRGDIRQSKPVAYQESNGTREEVDVNYTPLSGNRVGFQVGNYDPTRTLIIDPVLVYSTYLGGSGFDQGYSIAVDSLGSAYVTGRTAATDFPITAGAFQTNYGGGDAYIAKLNPAGTALVYSTYLNGASGNSIAVDSAGSAYITGEAGPPNFPTTPGTFRTSPMGFDTFVTKLNPAGTALVYSARFGGNFDDFGRGIALDDAGNAFITGWTVCRARTCSFPTINAFQANYAGGNNDAFVTKINSSGSALIYSTYLGGGAILNGTDDWGEGIAVDSAGSAYVTGYTYSPDFPVSPGAYDTTREGLDAFVTKFAPDGTSLIYSTFIGGPSREQGQGIAVDTGGNAYVTGSTESSDNPFTPQYDGFPVTTGAFQSRGSFDAFVTKLNPKGSGLVYSTYLGGKAGVDRGWGIAVDNAGSAYVIGDTTSTDFPTANPIQRVYGGGARDAFITRLNPPGSALDHSTFLGGSLSDEGRGLALNDGGDIFATGDTSSDDFPTANPLQGTNGGGFSSHDDAFVLKLGSGILPSPTPTVTPTPTPTATPTATPAPTPKPAPVPLTVSSVTLNPNSLTAGTSTQGTVTLSGTAPVGGALIKLTSSDMAASVPPSVTVLAGATAAKFTISTKPLTGTRTVTISAVYGGLSREALLTLHLDDNVTLQRPDYLKKKKVLRINASSSEPSATLRVYVTATGALIGLLKNDGGDSYSASLPWPANPQNITVRSSLGGSDSRAVTVK
jgi:hypothetical protein